MDPKDHKTEPMQVSTGSLCSKIQQLVYLRSLALTVSIINKVP